MVYSIPYLVLLLLFAILALTQSRMTEQLRERIWIPCAFLLFAFFALRGYVGDDWLGYYPAFAYVTPNDFHINIFGHHSYRYEIGFALLAYTCRQITGSDGFLFFQGVVTLIQIVLLIRFLRRYSDNLPFSIIIFLAMGGLIMLINTMRNTLAILIWINGLHYITERKPIPYFLYCLGALSFHMTSILFFPLYFILHRDMPRWLYLLVFIVGNLIVLLKIPVFSIGVGTIANLIGGKLAFMVQAYLGDAAMASISFKISIGSLERLGTGLVIYFLWYRLKEIHRENVLFVNAMIFFFLFYFLFSEVREVGKRLGDLFIFAYWILWPNMLTCIKSKLIKIGYVTFLCAYCVLKVIGTVGYPNTQYENILTGFTQMSERRIKHTEDMEVVRKSQQE